MNKDTPQKELKDMSLEELAQNQKETLERIEKTLQLQNRALRAYYAYHGETWEDISNEDELPLGDTLVMFLWREIGEAQGDPEEAMRMMNTVIGEVHAVYAEMCMSASA